MTKLLKPIESVTYSEEIIKSNFTTISGDELSFLLVPFSGNSYSHLWMGPLFSVPVNDKMKDPFTTSYLDGGYSGTSLEYLVTNVGDNIIVGNISNSVYDMSIDGLNFSVTIPLNSSYTGITSGLTTTTLYGAYAKTPLYDKKNTVGPCACSVMDNMYSEEFSVVTREINQGLPYNEGVNPESNMPYNSGIVYLFSDDIRKPNVSATTITTTNSWATGFGNDCPYTLNKKFPFNYTTDSINGYYMDQPVGAVDLLGGIITIFNEDLVNAFNFGASTGGTSTSGATFPTSAVTSTFKSIDLQQSLNMTLIAGKNEFITSTNPTWDPLVCVNKTYVTYLEIYDETGQLVAKGVADSPLEKTNSSMLVLDVQLMF